MLLNWKELLLKIISIPSMIKFLLYLGCNISGCLSIQNEMVCFPNSWGILLYRFVTSNVAMSVLGSIFSGMELKKKKKKKNLRCPSYNFLFYLGKVSFRKDVF